jgi:phosphoadenosine phosphosulfate reductase
VVRRKDGTTAFGPIWNWKTEDVWAYIARHQLPVNPVYARLRAIGAPESALRLSHVLDGNHLERGRVTWLRRGWPNLYEHLRTVLPRIAEFV